MSAFTTNQKACIDMLSEWLGGDHHLPKVHVFDGGVCINVSASISTFDDSKLTRLVLLAHRDAVRIEIAPSTPHYFKVIAHKRVPKEEGKRFFEYHPDLDEIIKSATDMKP